LIADDDSLFRDTTADLLSRAGYHCTCAEDAHEAERRLAEESFDLLIADVKMPGNTHLELVGKAHELAMGMPIMLVTGYPSLQSAVEAVRLPVCVYLLKPVDFDDLLRRVEECITRGRLFRITTSARERIKQWDGQLQRLAELFSGASKAPLANPAEVLLGGTFESLVNSVEQMGRVLATLHATENVMPMSELSVLESKTKAIQSTLREAVAVLEQSKYVFKSKRLGELRKDFQDLLDNLEGGKENLPRRKGQAT
jgi:DNA-binding response OmpR family regulator